MTVPIATITALSGQLTAESTLSVGPVTVPVPERTTNGDVHRDRRIADWYVENDVITVGVVRRHFTPGEPVIVLDEHGRPDGSGRFSAPLVDGRFVIMVGGSRRDVHAIRLPRQDDAEWGVRDAVTSMWVGREFYSEVGAEAHRVLMAEHLTGPEMLRVVPVLDGSHAAGVPRLAELEREVDRLRDGLVDVATIATTALVEDTASRQVTLERVAERVALALDGGG